VGKPVAPFAGDTWIGVAGALARAAAGFSRFTINTITAATAAFRCFIESSYGYVGMEMVRISIKYTEGTYNWMIGDSRITPGEFP
jgi:hypothetical protein